MSSYILLSRRAASGTGGGEGNSTQFVPVGLTQIDADSTGLVSLNPVHQSFTLPAGTYRAHLVSVFGGSLQFVASRLQLYAGAAGLDSTNGYVNTAADVATHILGRFTLLADTELQLARYVFAAQGVSDLGAPVSIAGRQEVYDFAEFWRE